jgi:hypothetical protein
LYRYASVRMYHARVMGVDPAELGFEIDVNHPEMRAYLEQMRRMYGGHGGGAVQVEFS